MLEFISNSEHYIKVLSRCNNVKHTLWIGTNLTGAGIGMKGRGTRNFDPGILTDNPEIVVKAMNQFDKVWIGKMCKGCKRKDY